MQARRPLATACCELQKSKYKSQIKCTHKLRSVMLSAFRLLWADVNNSNIVLPSFVSFFFCITEYVDTMLLRYCEREKKNKIIMNQNIEQTENQILMKRRRMSIFANELVEVEIKL